MLPSRFLSNTSHPGALPPDPPGNHTRSLDTLHPGALPPDPPGNSLRASLTAAGILAAAVAGAAGCGDDSCGPGGVSSIGLIASNPVVVLTYGQLTGGLNNDCPAKDAPAGLISMSIEGTQLDGQGRITLCIGRPDLLGTQALSLGFDRTAPVSVVDFAGSDKNCTYTADRTMPLTGTAHATGLCSNGADPAGFALMVDATLSLARTCGTTVDTTGVILHGRVAVSASK